MEVIPLTKRQADVLYYIIGHVEAGDGAPTIREIGEAFGMSSTGSVRDVFQALIQKGYMVHNENKARGRKLNPEVFEITVKGKRRIKIKRK